MTSAVVFAYHNVGVRCLQALLDHGINVKLVISHEDNPGENIWFDSVVALAKLRQIPVVTIFDPANIEHQQIVAKLEPDFIFSFYYRSMLPDTVLSLAKKGAFNMHGSLLPKYRGRVPVNWAIIKGERETGVTLHQMVSKPDAGNIVDQQAIPILENDTALDVFNKITVCAELILHRSLPKLIKGTLKTTLQDLSKGNYFGGRKPEDGIINWQETALNIHNLVRAVAPPYPGAWTNIAARSICIMQTLVEKNRKALSSTPRIYVEKELLFADCADGNVLQITTIQLNGKILSTQDFQKQFGLSVNLI